MEKELFNLVESLDQDNLDTLSIHDSDGWGHEKSYRVYQKDGYAFDVEKTMNENTGNIEYSFYSMWDHFKELPLEKAIELIKKEGVFV